MNEIYPHYKKNPCSLSHGGHSEWICSVQSFSHVQLFVTPCPATYQASPSITSSQSLLKFMSSELVMPSNYLMLCYSLLLHSIFPASGFFPNESVLHNKWPKYCSFSFSIRSSDEYSGLISFRIYWFVLLAVQVTCKSLFQHNSSKASILQHSAFFMVRLSHAYLTTGKTILLTRQTFFGKVMPLFFNMLSSFVIYFLQRSKCLLISWLQLPFVEPKKIKCHCFHCFPICLPWSDGIGCHDLNFLNVEL